MDTRPSGLAERAAEAIERQDRLRPVEDALQRAIAALFGAGGSSGRAVKNGLHGTWLGHPLHPVLTDVPVGAWTVALVLDGLDARAGDRRWRRPADGALTVGIAGAVAAALAGLTDWQHTDGAPRRSGLAHAVLNTVALGLYTGSLLLRRRGARRAGRGLAGAGFGVLVASAYLGGRLVYHHRIGVDHAQRDMPTGFGRVLPEAELREGEPRRAEVGGVGVVLVRHAGRIYALGEACSHLGGPLAEGEVRETSVVCPWHGSRFALEDGRVLDGPATMPQPCFETRVSDGYVEVRGPAEHGRAAA
jgi:nitrite reductase/ring-hydroxylating ferredoxin subunit